MYFIKILRKIFKDNFFTEHLLATSSYSYICWSEIKNNIAWNNRGATDVTAKTHLRNHSLWKNHVKIGFL